MKPEKAKLVIDGLKKAGINFSVGVPDSQFIQVYRTIAKDPDMHYVGAANEGEAPVSPWGPGLQEKSQRW